MTSWEACIERGPQCINAPCQLRSNRAFSPSAPFLRAFGGTEPSNKQQHHGTRGNDPPVSLFSHQLKPADVHVCGPEVDWRSVGHRWSDRSHGSGQRFRGGRRCTSLLCLYSAPTCSCRLWRARGVWVDGHVLMCRNNPAQGIEEKGNEQLLDRQSEHGPRDLTFSH